MNKEIILTLKASVYGHKRIYPSCHIASALLKLKGTRKTFDESDLEVFKSLGLSIQWKAGKI